MSAGVVPLPAPPPVNLEELPTPATISPVPQIPQMALAGWFGLAGGALSVGVGGVSLTVFGWVPWWWQSIWLLWLPAMIAAGAMLGVEQLDRNGVLGQRRWPGIRLRLAAWGVATLAPFPAWWLRAPHSLYLAWCAFLAFLAIACFFWEIANVIVRWTTVLGWKRFRVAAILVRVLLYYTQILPLLASALLVGGTIILSEAHTFHDLPRFMDGIHPLLRYAGLPGAGILAALILAFTLRLAWREPGSMRRSAAAPPQQPQQEIPPDEQN